MTAHWPDGAVADHDDGGALAHSCSNRGVVAGAHHVGEREQPREQLVVRPVAEPGDRDQRAVGHRDPHGLALAAVDRQALLVLPAPPGAVHARRLHAVAAVRAGAVRQRERRDHEVADRQRRHVGAEVLHDAHELVPDPVRLGRLDHAPVRPQVRPAHAGGGDAHERVGRPLDRGVGNVLDPDVTGGVDQSGAHGGLPNRLAVTDRTGWRRGRGPRRGRMGLGARTGSPVRTRPTGVRPMAKKSRKKKARKKSKANHGKRPNS